AQHWPMVHYGPTIVVGQCGAPTPLMIAGHRWPALTNIDDVGAPHSRAACPVRSCQANAAPTTPTNDAQRRPTLTIIDYASGRSIGLSWVMPYDRGGPMRRPYTTDGRRQAMADH